VDLDVEQVDDGGHDVERRRRVVAHLALPLARRLDEQGDPEHLVLVPGEQVAGELRRGQVDPVVGHHDDKGVVPGAHLVEVVDQLAHEGVGGADLQQVGLLELPDGPVEGRVVGASGRSSVLRSWVAGTSSGVSRHGWCGRRTWATLTDGPPSIWARTPRRPDTAPKSSLIHSSSPLSNSSRRSSDAAASEPSPRNPPQAASTGGRRAPSRSGRTRWPYTTAA